MPKLFRFAKKRLTAWDARRTDVEICEIEFRTRDGQPDLRPSVYETEDSQLVQTCAEHSAALISPPNPSIAIHAAVPGFSTRMCPGDTGFSFTVSVHREIEISDERDLLRFVHEIRLNLEERTHRVSQRDREEYALSRIASRDHEWIAAVKRSKDRPGSWVGKIALPEDAL